MLDEQEFVEQAILPINIVSEHIHLSVPIDNQISHFTP